MNLEIHANAVRIDYTEESVLLIGFAENPEEPEDNFVIIQYHPDLEEEERKMGWTKYYLEISSFSEGAYNCVESVSLLHESLTIELSSFGKSEFNIDNIIIYFKIDDRRFTSLTEAIITAFANEIGKDRISIIS